MPESVNIHAAIEAWKFHPQARLRGFKERRRHERYFGEPHQHERWQWYGVMAGEIRVTIAGQAITLTPGTNLLIRPHVDRIFDGLARQQHYYFAFMDLDGLALEEIEHRLLLLTPELNPLQSRILEEGNHATCENARVYCETLLLQLMIAYRRSHLDPAPDPANDRQVMRRVERFISQHLDRRIYRRELADLVGLSESQLARICKTVTGGTLSDLIARQRLLEAQRLLIHTDLSIAAIALELGFDSFEPFTRLFKTLTGSTPSSWRTGMRESVMHKA